jgi:hypothetical protein
VLWIRILIRKDLHHFGNLDPHQIQSGSGSASGSAYIFISWIPPHQFADVKLKCTEYEPILALFKGFEPFFFEARIWILEPDPGPHQGEKVESGFAAGSASNKKRIRIRMRVISGIRIRIRIHIKVMRIHNTDLDRWKLKHEISSSKSLFNSLVKLRENFCGVSHFGTQ